MITRCPECGSKFRISVDIIRAEDSTVRCGDCMSVFDARMQLVDEASESTYIADSARERAARLRRQRHQPTTHAPDGGRGDGQYREYQADGHGAGWVDADSHSDGGNRNSSTEYPAGSSRPHPQGQLLIDRRDSETDIDLDKADTIAYQPLNQISEDPQPQMPRAEQAAHESVSLDLELAEREKAGRDVNTAASDYSRRIDPLINPDDKSIEFERTLALDGLAGLDSGYSEQRGQGVRRRSVVEKSVEAASVQYNGQTSAYVGEHQFESLVSDADYGLERAADIESESRLRGSTDFAGDRDAVSRSIEPPRSERHLDTHRSRYQGYASGDVYDREPEYDEFHDGQSFPALEGEADHTESTVAMRQHLNARGIEIESDDEYEYFEERRSNSTGWWLLALLAVVCAAAFYARDDIAKSGLPQSVRAGFCAVAGCQLPVGSDIADLELLRQKVYSHPTIEDTLVVSIDVVNNAVFPQPYPVLSVTMANSGGESVAQRDFVPADYLETYAGTETLEPGKPTRINIDIVDPGEDAQSFEMEFRPL